MRTRILTALLVGALLMVAVPALLAQTDATDEPTAESTGPTATIDANVLNVRSEPTTASAIIGKVGFDETYTVLRGTADSSWWQIQLPDAVGWVSANWVTVSNVEGVPLDAPVVSATQSATVTVGEGATATVRVPALNVRDEPSTTTGEVITTVRSGEVYPVLDQNDTATWWLIDVNGTQGWVSAAFVNVENFVFATAVPAATQEASDDDAATAQPTQAQPTATATP